MINMIHMETSVGLGDIGAPHISTSYELNTIRILSVRLSSYHTHADLNCISFSISFTAFGSLYCQFVPEGVSIRRGWQAGFRSFLYNV